MTPPYTVDYFIQKFEAIPDEKWTTGEFIKDEGRCCVLGHCGSRIGLSISAEAIALECLVNKFLPIHVITINDGVSQNYRQPTPKARILAALRDIQKKQEGG